MCKNKLPCYEKRNRNNLVMRKIYLPLTKDVVSSLKIGDELLLSGTIYTARDAAHKRLCELISKNKKLPIDIDGVVIYYCGPAPAKKNKPIGSCGPTTSKRMDSFTPALLSKGMAAMIGKGRRSKDVIASIKNNKGVYFIAIGGAGAYLADRVKRSELICYKDLEPEAIYKLWVEDFPVVVGIDSKGNSIFK